VAEAPRRCSSLRAGAVWRPVCAAFGQLRVLILGFGSGAWVVGRMPGWPFDSSISRSKVLTVPRSVTERLSVCHLCATLQQAIRISASSLARAAGPERRSPCKVRCSQGGNQRGSATGARTPSFAVMRCQLQAIERWGHRSPGRPPSTRRHARWSCASRAKPPLGLSEDQPASSPSSTSASPRARSPRPPRGLPEAVGTVRPGARFWQPKPAAFLAATSSASTRSCYARTS
jgi:hypothetical protein